MNISRIRGRSSIEEVFDNDDLLMEILMHICVRHLIHLQMVNNRWKSLISSPCFGALHCKSGKSQLGLSIIVNADQSTLLCINLEGKYLRRLSLGYHVTRILQVCHGLILLQCKISKHSQEFYKIYNPTTGKSRVLMSRKRVGENGSICGLCLVYDPAKCSSSYQVVCVMNKHPEYWIRIFQSDSGKWIDINQNFTSGTRLRFWHGVYCNNGVYWINSTVHSFHLDLISCTFQRLPIIRLPKGKAANRMKKVFETNGHLYSFFSRYDGKVVVYELLEGNLGWIKKYTFIPSRIWMLGCVGGETMEAWKIFYWKDTKMVCESLSDGVVDVVYDFEEEEEEKSSVSKALCYDRFQNQHLPHHFFESLAPV